MIRTVKKVNNKYLLDIKDEIISVVNTFVPYEKLLILFGSFSQSLVRRISDIDLALYTGQKLNDYIFLELKEYLNENVHTLREIDMISLDDNIPRDFIEDIIYKGIIWIDSKDLMRTLKRHLKSMEIS